MRLCTASLAAVAFLLAACAERPPEQAAAASAPAVVARPFAWPPDLAPLPVRGGTTTGAPVAFAPAPSPAWTALQAAQGVERDRAAIRAMAGEYRVDFDFQELIAFKPGAAIAAPYRSWATERIFVIEDTPTRIALQHQLVMRFAGEPEAAVIKHWRQVWTWQDGDLLRYRGHAVWERERLAADAVAGCWSQAVYGVADEPRYETVGRWRHAENLSEWSSDLHWRPLPRRETTARADYHVLEGSHRIVVAPGGWVLWQDNRKLALTEAGRPAAAGYVASEIGCERYSRLAGFDWTPAPAVWEREAALWARVRSLWDELLAGDRTRLTADAIGGRLLGTAAEGDVDKTLAAVRATVVR